MGIQLGVQFLEHARNVIWSVFVELTDPFLQEMAVPIAFFTLVSVNAVKKPLRKVKYKDVILPLVGITFSLIYSYTWMVYAKIPFDSTSWATILLSGLAAYSLAAAAYATHKVSDNANQRN